MPGKVTDNVEGLMNPPKVAAGTGNPQRQKHLIVTGDDFGRNSRINEAVEHAHQAGWLTQASLMVNEPGVEEAARIAKRNPGLTVGLHLTLCDGLASCVSAITDRQQRLAHSPALAGLRYAFDSRLKPALQAEIAAQFEKFRGLGFQPVYWDGHTHLHLHPAVLKLSLPIATTERFRVIRLVREPGWGLLPVVFKLLSHAARGRLNQEKILYVDRVFGLRHTGQMTTRRVESLAASLPPGWNEIYFHPGAEPADLDYQVLTELLNVEGITLGSSRELIGENV